MRTFGLTVLVAGLVTVFVLPATAVAGTITYRNALRANGSGQFSVTVHKAVSFRLLLRTPTQGRTRLFLLGKTAPRGGPLIDTASYACEGAAGSLYCSGAYEPLPGGTYAFRIVHRGGKPERAPVEFTVRW